MMKRFWLSALGLIPLLVSGQFSSVEPLILSNITSGNAQGHMSDEFVVDDPATTNVRYTDADDVWPLVAFDSAFDHALLLHTKDADKATTGGSTVVSVDTDVHAHVCVWHDDIEVAKPSWLTSGYTDSGFDASIDDEDGFASAWCAIKAPATINFGGNCPTGGCISAPSMYMVSFLPAGFPLAVQTGGEPATGTLQFDPASATCDEETACQFSVTRTGGTAGACSVTVAEGTNPGNGTLDDTSLSWSADEGGSQSGTETFIDVSGDQFMTLDISSPVGCTLGTPTAVTLNIIDLDTSPSAQTWFVDTATGNDSDDGLTFANAFKTIARALGTSAVSGGHVDIFIEGGTYREPWIPVNGGTDSTHTIRLKPRTGDVTLKGPVVASPDCAGSACQGFAAEIDVDWVSMLSDSGHEFIIDGECTAIKEGGRTGCNLKKVIRVLADNVVMEFSAINTGGWTGAPICGDNIIIRANYNQHGNPWESTVEDFGDTAGVNSNCDTTDKILFEGGTWLKGGHDHVASRGSNVIWREIVFSSDWSGVSGYASEDGSRLGAFTTQSRYSFCESNIWKHPGSTSDSALNSIMKLEGRWNVCRWNFFIDGHDNAILQESGGWSRHAQDNIVAHNVFFSLFSEGIRARGYSSGTSFTGLKYINNIFLDTDTRDDGNDRDSVLSVTCEGILPQPNADISSFEFRGNLIFADGYTDLTDVMIYFAPVCGGDDRQTLAYYETNFPLVFSDNMVGDPLFVTENLNPATVAIAITDFATQGGSPARDNAVWLTHANGGGTGTVITLDNADFFRGPYGFAAPNLGPDSGAGCFQIRNITQVWTTCVLSRNQSNNDVTLSTTETWSDNDEIGYVNTDIGAVDS